MSLQVWLPLNGNLNNQGLVDWKPTLQSGTTSVYVNGKIGKALNTGGIVIPANITKQILNNDEFSYACWIYPNGATDSTSERAIIFGNNNGRQFSLFQYPTSNDLHWSWANYNGSSWSSNYGAVLTDVLPSYQWTHIIVVYNKNITEKIKIYINGIKQTISANNFTSTSTTFEFDTQLIHSSSYHYLNDIRLYNHALSEKEVKEISKGSILHYPLKDEFIEPSQNLCTSSRPGTAANSTWGGHITIWTNYDASNDPVPFNEGLQGVITYGTNGSTGGGASRSVCTVAASPSTIYTYSFYIKASDDFEYTNGNFIYRYEYTAVSGGSKVKEGGLFNNSRMQSLGHGWYRCWGTYTTQDTTNAINISFYTYPSKNVTYWIGGWQIEQKDHMTPFMKPNGSRNYTVEYDCSGYGNDGTVTGTITPSSDTMRYNASYTFDGSQRISADALPAETQTISVWAKTTKNKSTAQCILGDSASGICMFIYSGGLITYFRGSAGGAGSRVTFGSEYKENDWNHFVVVKTGDTTRDVYCNGVKLATAANNYYTHAEGFWVGARNSSNQIPFYGQISDIRAFATALSAEDIKKLYQVSASVDNQGNLHAYEVVER